MTTLKIDQNEGSALTLIAPLIDPERAERFDTEDPEDELFNLSTEVFVPANVRETETDYILELNAPGFEKTDIAIDVDENDILTIRAESMEDEWQSEEYQRREFVNRSFSRSFQLPEGIVSDEISGEYKNGIIILIIPKVQEDKKITFVLD
ncbi:MAG: Hsp20/alpha crystallin family protein [Bacteroidia bacterium]